MNISNFQTANLKNRQFTNGEFLKTQWEQSNFFDFLKSASVQNKNITNTAQNVKQAKTSISKPLNPKEYFTSSNMANKNQEKFEKKEISEEKVQEGKKSNLLQTKNSYQQMKKGYEAAGNSQLNSQFADEKDLELLREEMSNESEAIQHLQSVLQAISTMIEEVKEVEGNVQTEFLESIVPLEHFEALEAKIEALITNADPKEIQESVRDVEAFLDQMKEALQTQPEAKESDPESQNTLQDLFEELNVSSVKVQELKTQVLQSNNDTVSEESIDEFNLLDAKANQEQHFNKADQTQADARGSDMLSGSDKAVLKTQSLDVSEDFDEFTNAIHSLDKELKADLIGVKNAAGLVKNTSVQEIYSQIKEGMSKIDLSASMQEIVIKLKPEELGRVELKLELYKDLVIARFDVESQAVKEAIESNLKDLRSSLEQSGFTNMQFDVNVNDNGEGSKEEYFVFSRGRGVKEITLNEQIQEKNARLSLNSIVEETSFEYLA